MLVWCACKPASQHKHSICLLLRRLQGFVSNKTSGTAAADPLEKLLYQIFVAASDRVTVAKLADILNVDVPTLRLVRTV